MSVLTSFLFRVYTGKTERFREYPKLQELIRLKVSPTPFSERGRLGGGGGLIA